MIPLKEGIEYLRRRSVCPSVGEQRDKKGQKRDERMVYQFDAQTRELSEIKGRLKAWLYDDSLYDKEMYV